MRASRPLARDEAVRSHAESGPILLRMNPESPERGAKPKAVRLQTRSQFHDQVGLGARIMQIPSTDARVS